jgi:saccharopine dehydrogenase-like NADP-dependent oxidoreductase
MSKSILIVGGYGVVGSRIAADLAPEFPDRVVLAGRNLERADAAAAAIGHGVRGQRVDVAVASSIAEALTDVSVVVNCIVQPERGLLWAAAQRGLAYTDITPHLTSLGRGAGYDRVHAAAIAGGARILLGAGTVPGISSVMVRALAEHIGGAERIETALLLSARDLAGPGSFDYLLQELTMGFDVHVEGLDRPARPYTAPRRVAFPVPVGPRPAYLFPFSDQVLYPRTMGARTVVTRLGVDPTSTSRLLSLLVGSRATHLAALPAVRSAVGRVRRRRSETDRGDAEYARYALRVDVGNGEHTAFATLTGIGQAQATAVGAAALVRSLVDGEIAEPGAWMPEQVVDPHRFFARLARRGLQVETMPAAPSLP